MKRMLKGIIGAAMVAAFAAGFTACSGSKGVEVGIVLPTKDEPRWIQDETSFKKLLEGKASVELLFSQGDPNKEKQNVEALLNKGIKVLLICPHDGAAAAAAVEQAKKDGVTVISYDRLVTDTNAVDYYVTFDSFEVGVAQGQYLIDNAEKGKKGQSLYLYAGAASDNNAFIFFEGAWSVLQPKIADIINQVTTDWNFDTAKKKAADNLTVATDAEKGKCFVLAPNDGTARAIADEFAKDPAVTSYVITGQDAELASAQYIIDGKQSMTVWKNTAILARDAISMALDVLDGKVPETTSTYDNNVKKVPAKQTAITVIDKGNVKLLAEADYNGAATALKF